MTTDIRSLATVLSTARSRAAFLSAELHHAAGHDLKVYLHNAILSVTAKGAVGSNLSMERVGLRPS
jgi:hypothetical protein